MNTSKGRFKPLPIAILLLAIVSLSYWAFAPDDDEDREATRVSTKDNISQEEQNDCYYLKGYDLVGNVKSFRELEMDFERMRLDPSVSNTPDMFKPEFTDYFFDRSGRITKEKRFVDGDFRVEVVYKWAGGMVASITIKQDGKVYRIAERNRVVNSTSQKKIDIEYGPGAIIYRSVYSGSSGEHLFEKMDVVRKGKLLGKKLGPSLDNPDTFEDYSFNDLGQPNTVRWKSYVGKDRTLVDLNFTYHYAEYDEYDNWVGRVKKDEDGEAEEGIVRSITYY